MTAGGISGTGLLERAIHLMFETLFRHPETQRSTGEHEEGNSTAFASRKRRAGSTPQAKTFEA
jgi:hypothetical protein